MPSSLKIEFKNWHGSKLFELPCVSWKASKKDRTVEVYNINKPTTKRGSSVFENPSRKRKKLKSWKWGSIPLEHYNFEVVPKIISGKKAWITAKVSKTGSRKKGCWSKVLAIRWGRREKVEQTFLREGDRTSNGVGKEKMECGATPPALIKGDRRERVYIFPGWLSPQNRVRKEWENGVRS